MVAFYMPGFNSLRNQAAKCFRKGMRYLTLGLKLQTNNLWKHFYEGFMWDGCIWGVKVNSYFFMALKLSSLVAIRKEILRNPEFLTAWIKQACKNFLQYILKVLDIILEQFSETTIIMAPIDVLCILVNQHIIGTTFCNF